MTEWIPVSERLPDEEVRVLATDGTDVFDSEYMNGNWEWCAEITHWAPLPEVPEVTWMACPICDQKPMDCDCTETERRQFSEIEDLKAEIERLRLTGEETDRCGLVAAMIQTDEDGGVFGIRIQERDEFPPKELIPLYLSPQLTLTPAERQAVEATIVDLDGGANFNEQRAWPDLAKRLRERYNTLRGLLERVR